MYAASRVDYHIYHKLAWPMLGVSVVLLVLVLLIIVNVREIRAEKAAAKRVY